MSGSLAAAVQLGVAGHIAWLSWACAGAAARIASAAAPSAGGRMQGFSGAAARDAR